MANREHVKVVRQGAVAIAEWRRQNPGVSLDLRGAHLRRTGLEEADLRAANLRGAKLGATVLRKANLRGTTLAYADLAGADLRGARCTDADLSSADLSRANVGRADLRWADLTWCRLARANLRAADLTGARLRRTDLSSANLSGSRLFGVHLFEAYLTGTNLTKAYFGSTSLGDCDVSQTTGLSAVIHLWASSIGVETLMLSFRGAGNRLTPDLETFFLGAGVPKEFLRALPGIVGAVEYHSCFISYGQPDLEFARKLRDDLVARGVSCWLYALDATPGERTWREIRTKQRETDKMVVVCSAAALIRDGVLKEIEEQIDEDPDKMVPISRDNIWIQPGFRVVRGTRDLGPFLRDRNYADFSDESCYDEALQRLLKALRRKAE